jgi:hypothetical protein
MSFDEARYIFSYRQVPERNPTREDDVNQHKDSLGWGINEDITSFMVDTFVI